MITFDDKQIEKIRSLDIEKAVLASLMSIDNIEIPATLTKDCFYAKRHQQLFAIISHLASQRVPFDTISVFDYAENQGLLDELGGEEYLGDIVTNSPATLYNFDTYCNKLLQLAQRRKIYQAYAEAQAKIINVDNAIDDVFNDTSETINKTLEVTAGESYQKVDDCFRDFILHLQECNKTGYIPSRKTGIITFDNKVQIMDGDMCVIAGRPSMGKTTFAQNALVNIAENEEGHAVFFSLEMPKRQVIGRLLSNLANVEMHKIMTKQDLTENDWSNILAQTNRIKNLPLTIDDRAGLTVNQIRTTLNKIRQREGKISAIMVDYMQLMQASGNKANRNAEIDEISRGLKALAKEFNCPMIVLSQLSRNVESRPNKRPLMSDLRESGAIEQDADQVIFIYRDEYYNKDSKEKGIAELLVRKFRNGETGTVKVAFKGQFNRFEDIIYDGEN